MEAVELLTRECNYKGLYLVETRKTDGIIYTTGLVNNYGMIIDTKAYSKVYDLPISQVDEMPRDIEKNTKRECWKNLGDNVNDYNFSFVLG